MNDAQKKVERFMQEQIEGLNHGMHMLVENAKQPNELGDIYNGILRHNVSFEIQRMEHLKRELMELLD